MKVVKVSRIIQVLEKTDGIWLIMMGQATANSGIPTNRVR